MGSDYLRRHAVGLVAIAIALTGTAVAATPHHGGGADRASTSKQLKKLKQRVTALETQLATPASGDISGTYPNLTIANNAVGATKIADNAVGSSKIADNAVGSSEIAENAVASSEIAENAVGSSEIADDAVASSEIADDAVASGEIAADAVTASEIADDSVGGGELQDNSVTSGELGTVSIRTGGAATATNVPNNQSLFVTSSSACDPGEEDLSGSALWDDTANSHLALQSSSGLINNLVYGANNGSGAAHDLFPTAFCLAP